MSKRATSEMIVDVAAGLFATSGLSRTTMETIAAAAGRGRRTVYMYFRNKAEIYDAVVQMEISRITSPLAYMVHSGDDPGIILPRYGEERARRLHDLLRRNPLLMRDFAQGHSRVEKLRGKLHRSEIRIITPLFQRYATGGLKKCNPSPGDCASLYLSMLQGNDILLTKKDGLREAIRLASFSAWILLRALECDCQPENGGPES